MDFTDSVSLPCSINYVTICSELIFLDVGAVVTYSSLSVLLRQQKTVSYIPYKLDRSAGLGINVKTSYTFLV